MSIARALKRRVRALVAPGFFFALTGYFCWNAVQGEHGLVAFAARKGMLAQAQADLAEVEAARLAWSRRVSGLQADHIDADTLDEQARAMLNLSGPDDVILMYPDKDKLF
ncbi:MAG TPA: septum formation initiator family protein [Acetobacteraceae bacterium]|jgi:cell division protein FtsB|nr:septum formation initiator family protein [Acetobacteraceae bacterium]